MGRGPAGRRAGDAAIVALHVRGARRGGLIVATISLCLRISVKRLLGGPKLGALGSTQYSVFVEGDCVCTGTIKIWQCHSESG